MNGWIEVSRGFQTDSKAGYEDNRVNDFVSPTPGLIGHVCHMIMWSVVPTSERCHKFTISFLLV